MDRVLRQRRQQRIRARVSGTAERPRVSIFRSNNYVWVQLIDDTTGTTLGAVHGKAFAGVDKIAQAKQLGEALAAVAKEKGVQAVVFDRSGYQYHGRIKAIAEALREAGLAV